MYILAQILGILAIILWVYSILLKSKKDILLSQIVANAIYMIEYFLLNALSASIMNLSSFIRLLIYYKYEKNKLEVPKTVLLLFIIIILLIGIFTYKNLFTFIHVIITILYAISLWQNNLLKTRIVYVVCGIIWVFYNIQVNAYVSVLGNIFEIIFGIYSIIKYKSVK